MEEVIIGIDPSSKKLASVTTFDAAPILEARPLPSGKDINVKCHLAEVWLYGKVRKLLNQGYRVHVFIEDPVYVRGATALIMQSQVNGALRAGAHRGGAITVMGVNNQRWKKIVIGHGNASKADIAGWCSQCWPNVAREAGKDQDLKDAAGINRYGVEILSKQKRISKMKENQ